MPHGLWVGGLDVASKAIRAVSLNGLLAIPEKTGENQSIFGMNGAVRTPRKKYAGRRAPFEFQVWGRLPDGTVPADTEAQLRVNLKILGQMISQEVMPMVHRLPDGTFRECPVEVAVALEPELVTADYATVPIAFDSASAFWRAQNATTASFSIANNGTRTLTEFADSEGPIDDAVVTIGPSTNPRFEDLVSGTYFQYLAQIPNGQTLVVDAGTKKLSGTGGLVPDRTKLRTHPEDGRWLALCPGVGVAPSVRFTQTGGSASVPITAVAKQSWMFG